jgi:hypothetical protein
MGDAQRPISFHDRFVVPQPSLYIVRIRGQLGPTALSAFPSMVHELKGSETVLTGLLHDRSAVFGLVAEVEALGLELLELRQVQPRPNEPR